MNLKLNILINYYVIKLPKTSNSDFSRIILKINVNNQIIIENQKKSYNLLTFRSERFGQNNIEDTNIILVLVKPFQKSTVSPVY